MLVVNCASSLIGEFSSVDEMGEGEDEEQLSSLVLYEDINGYLFSLRSHKARLSLVYQFIDFFGARISPWTSSNSLSWSEKVNSLETLSDSMLEILRSVHECLSKSDSANGLSLGSLLGGSSDISMQTEMMKFIRNAILLCLHVFPRNYILEEAVLVAEELFVTNMKTCEVATTPCQALAKRLLKSDRQVSPIPIYWCDLRFYSVYLNCLLSIHRIYYFVEFMHSEKLPLEI